ncbi:zinc ABC transporter permease subunit ZnuB [Govanella unica]|uniref:High-affinity zinc uptake system membrane protein ZnuB n=1 Tax=Govanella unica TaxID=2975056 RepID=A0A9X3Z7L6_9PROT|nr:zinc ABC transporter permease subunit ZnuB [Govania unica]
MLDDFMIRALLAGLAIAVVAGPLGSVLVWRRMAYFGDALSHSALLGVAMGFAIGVNPQSTIILVCVGVAVALSLLERQRSIAVDTLLGIMAHSALAFGLVVMSFVQGPRFDLIAFLFGDILSVSWADVGWIVAGVTAVVLLLIPLWPRLLAITVHEDLARIEGVRVQWVRFGYMLLIAIVIAAAMRVVGVLLITALLIIPAAAARRRARTPEDMAAGASLVGMLAVLGGLGGSYWFDTPAGPSVVACASLLFFLSFLLPRRA